MEIITYYNQKIKGLSFVEIFSRIINKAKLFFWRWFFLLYRLYIPFRVKKIRRKQQVRVLFVLAELGAWKTEMLYLEMLKNLKYTPVLGVTRSLEVPGSKEKLIAYLNTKQYSFIDLDTSNNRISEICPDLVFYYKPYDTSIPRCHIYKNHLRVLPCFINYGFSTIYNGVTRSNRVADYSIFHFVENELVAKAKKKELGIRAKNLVVTGIPMQDALCRPINEYKNPWKDTKGRKKIIYAPHHSLEGTNDGGIVYSTFMEYGEYLFQLAKKYKDYVCVAFKPHPTLYVKLCRIWGKAKTDEYYAQWNRMENTQLELGEYTGLFRYSDAMIHDCSSFIVEYLYSKAPVLFLHSKTVVLEDLNDFALEAFNLHYKAHNKEDIENFVLDVIKGIDTMKEKRDSFYESQLLPPNGLSASQNIVNHISNQFGL